MARSYRQHWDEQPAALSEVIAGVEAIIEDPGIGTVHRAGQAGYPETDLEIHYNPHRFLFLLLKGSARVAFPGDEGVRRLMPGDIALYAPGSWHGIERSEDCSVFRFSIPEGEIRLGRRRHIQKPLQVYSLVHHSSFWIEGCFDRATDRETHAEQTRGYTQVLLWEVLRLCRSAPDARPSKAQHTWNTLRDYVEMHCHQPLDRSAVGAALKLHPSHVSRLYRSFANQTFQQHLESCRLKRAEALLIEAPHLSIAEIAALTGFTSHAYFSNVFATRTGKTPSHFRARHAD